MRKSRHKKAVQHRTKRRWIVLCRYLYAKMREDEAKRDATPEEWEQMLNYTIFRIDLECYRRTGTPMLKGIAWVKTPLGVRARWK